MRLVYFSIRRGKSQELFCFFLRLFAGKTPTRQRVWKISLVPKGKESGRENTLPLARYFLRIFSQAVTSGQPSVLKQSRMHRL